MDGIVLAPDDRDALVPAIARAKRAGIPLAVIDSGANTEDYVSFVATDNYGGGVMAAHRMADILKQKGKVAMICGSPGGASSLAREQGFKETLEKQFPNLHLVAWQYGLAATLVPCPLRKISWQDIPTSTAFLLRMRPAPSAPLAL